MNNVNGKMLNVIHNMYEGIKSCIVYNDHKTEFFPCDNFLFALFLNDLDN